MSIIEITRKYFDLFSNKDLKNLGKLFSKNISLIDWDINVSGKKNVIEAISNIFSSVDSIIIEEKNIYKNDNIALCEIKIVINKTQILKVIDIIKFNNKNEIIEISAYKQ